MRQRPEHRRAVGPNPDKRAGNKAYESATPEEEKSPVYKSPTHEGTSADGPYGGAPSMGAKAPPGRRAPVRTLAGHEMGSDTGPGAKPSYRQAGTEGGVSGPRSVDLRREAPARVAGPSSADPPEHQAVRTFRAVDPVRGRDVVPAGKQRSAGEQAQLAPGTTLGSTKFLLDPLWNERSSLLDLTQKVLRTPSGSPRELSTGTLHRGNLTQGAPPLEIPQPFSGFVPMMGGAAIGSGASGNGVAPLLAVIAPCLIALLYRGRFHTFCAFLRPRTVPRPALERPG